MKHLFLQLVCFYYVLTTFTTVGYGESVILVCLIFLDITSKLNKLKLLYFKTTVSMAGDIYASTNGERVISHDSTSCQQLVTLAFESQGSQLYGIKIIFLSRCFV